MYSVIIVDDELWTLLGIKKMFQWEIYGFELIGETTDSEEAKEMILNNNPDVVFTDINMPDISGIELMKMARERNRKTKFVVISGYADFKFAQESVKYGAFGYLLKPVSQEDADNLLSSLKEAFDKENGIFEEEESYKDIANLAFKNMITHINHNYMDKISLGEISKMFKLNASYCCQLFNKNFNCSFSDYIIDLRMKSAAKMLSEGKMTLQEIADYLNYDYSHFNKAFKKHCGVTPQQYKKGIRHL